MQLDKYVVFCSDPPDFRIEDGLVHVTDRSGKLVFERVMSLGSFRLSIAKAHEALAKLEYDHLPSEKAASVVSIRKRGK